MQKPHPWFTVMAIIMAWENASVNLAGPLKKRRTKEKADKTQAPEQSSPGFVMMQTVFLPMEHVLKIDRENEKNIDYSINYHNEFSNYNCTKQPAAGQF